ncbi:MAG: M13 family metallopeptidase [Lactobacillus panisapium]|nr:M13 family metallopeptidase [Lactobacillus panisapium]
MINFNVRGGAGNSTKADPNVRLQDNFYLAVNSQWMKDNPIPQGEPWINSFDEIAKKTRERLMQDFEEFADGQKTIPAVKNFDKAIEFYRIVKDFAKREEDGAAPIKADLAFLEGLTSIDDINQNLSRLLLDGNLPFGFEVMPDFKDAQLNVVTFNRHTLILSDTSYYDGKRTDELLATWQRQTTNLLTMAGIEENKAQQYASDSVKLDRRLAKVYQSAQDNAQIENTYHPMSVAEFTKKSQNLNLAGLLEEMGLEQTKFVIVSEPKYLDSFDDLFNDKHFAELKGWLISQFINYSATYLSRAFRAATLPLRKAMWGINELPVDKQFVYDQTTKLFGDVIGQYYGQKYLGEKAKADATEMVENMVEVYQERLQNNTWLSPVTKEKAIKKLATLKLKIGYPEHVQKFYDLFKVVPTQAGGTFYSNVRDNQRVKIEANFAKINQPVDHSIWIMSAIDANACYDPQNNDVTLPAIILQKPFYSLDQDRAANYGGFGTVIGHEISHAFDKNGAQFDELGNMKNWWTDKDFAEFNQRVKAEIALFDGVEVGSVKLNGKLCVSENIGDQGGLTVALEANKKDGGDAATLFNSYARIWETNSTTEFLQLLTSIDVHALPQARVNVQVQCQDEFYRAYDVNPTDGMWLEPAKRVQIW